MTHIQRALQLAEDGRIDEVSPRHMRYLTDYVVRHPDEVPRPARDAVIARYVLGRIAKAKSDHAAGGGTVWRCAFNVLAGRAVVRHRKPPRPIGWNRPRVVIARRLRDEQIVRDRKNGMSLRAIGEKHGITHQAVSSVLAVELPMKAPDGQGRARRC